MHQEDLGISNQSLFGLFRNKCILEKGNHCINTLAELWLDNLNVDATLLSLAYFLQPLFKTETAIVFYIVTSTSKWIWQETWLNCSKHYLLLLMTPQYCYRIKPNLLIQESSRSWSFTQSFDDSYYYSWTRFLTRNGFHYDIQESPYECFYTLNSLI